MSITKAISSHTPGPWEYSGGGIWGISPFNARVRLADITFHNSINGISSEANGRLIAAAPVLLGALKDAANFLAIATQDIIRSGDGKINESWATDIREAEKRARDAISQATVGL